MRREHPKLRHHVTGRGFVEIKGKRFYCGPWKNQDAQPSTETIENYNRAISGDLSWHTSQQESELQDWELYDDVLLEEAAEEYLSNMTRLAKIESHFELKLAIRNLTHSLGWIRLRSFGSRLLTDHLSYYPQDLNVVEHFVLWCWATGICPGSWLERLFPGRADIRKLLASPGLNVSWFCEVENNYRWDWLYPPDIYTRSLADVGHVGMVNVFEKLGRKPAYHRFEGRVSGVYFLFACGELGYIGSAVDIARRIRAHRRSKWFDSYTFIESSPFVRQYLEALYILKYRPVLNGLHNGDLKSYMVPSHREIVHSMHMPVSIRNLGRSCGKVWYDIDFRYWREFEPLYYLKHTSAKSPA